MATFGETTKKVAQSPGLSFLLPLLSPSLLLSPSFFLSHSTDFYSAFSSQCSFPHLYNPSKASSLFSGSHPDRLVSSPSNDYFASCLTSQCTLQKHLYDIIIDMHCLAENFSQSVIWTEIHFCHLFPKMLNLCAISHVIVFWLSHITFCMNEPLL